AGHERQGGVEGDAEQEREAADGDQRMQALVVVVGHGGVLQRKSRRRATVSCGSRRAMAKTRSSTSTTPATVPFHTGASAPRWLRMPGRAPTPNMNRLTDMLVTMIAAVIAPSERACSPAQST